MLDRINSVSSVEMIEDEFRLSGVVTFVEKRINKKDNRLFGHGPIVNVDRKAHSELLS
jgi:hypothetical protein